MRWLWQGVAPNAMFIEWRTFKAVFTIAEITLLAVNSLSRGENILAMWHLTKFHALMSITLLIYRANPSQLPDRT